MSEVEARGSGSYKAKFITLAVAFVLVVIILVQNSSTVTFRFLFWKGDVSQLVLIILVFAIGFVSGLLTTLTRRREG